MTRVLHHRGPDGEGFHLGPGVGLGFRRLSIIDLATGQQPIANEDQTVFVVCNGEIYNFKELRPLLERSGHRFRTRSDIEVIVHLWEDHGVDCLEHLRGMFALALWDARQQTLFLAVDRIGIKSLHYTEADDGTFYFASESKALLQADQRQRELDPLALKDLFRLGFILSPKTLLKHVRRVPPGHYLLYRSGRLTRQRYWDLVYGQPAEPGSPRRAGEWAEAVRAKLQEVVRIHLRSDVPVAAWLSPGIDSSAIAMLAARHMPQPIQAFSLGFADHPEFDELRRHPTLDQYPGYTIIGRRVLSQGAGLDLLPQVLWYQEDPVTSGVPLIRRPLCAETAVDHKVVLTGEGADELLAGYPWYRFLRLCRPFSVLPQPWRRRLLGPWLPRWKPWASGVFLAPRYMDLSWYATLIGTHTGAALQQALTPETLAAVDRAEDPGWLYRPLGELQRWHPLEALQYIEMKTRLVDYITRCLDRSTMAHSLEARVPFLDHELFELCARIPPGIKMRRLQEKHILRRAMAADLPAAIRKRRKRGMAAPNAKWLRAALPDFAADLLAPRQLRERGYFNPTTVARWLEEHRQRRVDRGRLLMIVLGVQLWDELFRRGGAQRTPPWEHPGRGGP